MYSVNNIKQLGTAYILLRYYEAGLSVHTKDRELIVENAKEVKRAIRKYVGQPASESRIVKDNGIDGYIVRFPLPESIQTEGEANDYFMAHCFIEARQSAYDCTGQAFTSWYRIVKMQGRFFAYHDVTYDV